MRIFGKLNTRNNGQFRLRIENPLSEQIEQEDEENAEKAPFCEIACGAAKKDADGFQCGGGNCPRWQWKEIQEEVSRSHSSLSGTSRNQIRSFDPHHARPVSSALLEKTMSSRAPTDEILRWQENCNYVWDTMETNEIPKMYLSITYALYTKEQLIDQGMIADYLKNQSGIAGDSDEEVYANYGNTAQRPPDGSVRHLRHIFS